MSPEICHLNILLKAYSAVFIWYVYMSYFSSLKYSVKLDQLLQKYMPKLASLFSHVLVDVSSVKALCIRWYPKGEK